MTVLSNIIPPPVVIIKAPDIGPPGIEKVVFGAPLIPVYEIDDGNVGSVGTKVIKIALPADNPVIPLVKSPK